MPGKIISELFQLPYFVRVGTKKRKGRRQGSAGPGWGCNTKFVVLHYKCAAQLKFSFPDN